MSFNVEKCKVIHRGHNNRQTTYNMEHKLQTSVEKDLGVCVDDRLKFKEHVSHAVNKGSRLLGMIRATFSCLDEDTMPRLYKALVRPHVDYGNIIWHPCYRVDKLEVEKVQRHATKLVMHTKDDPYES